MNAFRTPSTDYQQELAKKPGPLAWFAHNSVAANVIMLILLVAGIFTLFNVREEVFPEVQFPVVVVTVPYPGASPEEVEDGLVLAIEEAIRDVEGIKEVTGSAREGVAVVAAELEEGANEDRGLADIKSAVDRITSFPEDAERPNVYLATNRSRVVSIVLYGDVDTHALRSEAEELRSLLIGDERVSFVEVTGLPAPEIAIEVSQDDLRRYGLSLEQVAQRIRAASIDLPGGAIKTERGEILLRTTEKRQTGAEFESIVLLARPDGTQVTVGDIAAVKDDFVETDQEAYFNGKRAAMLDVYRVGEETPLDISAAVTEFIEKQKEELPGGLTMELWSDYSEIYRDRIDLLMRNAAIGLVLVLLTLGVFLEIRLAFWVTLGIPISFVGAFIFLPGVDVSINMLSLFGFIVVLGMVVDDAIVVGEAVHYNRQAGMGRLEAAIAGVREMAIPITFAVLTTMMAFAPMLFVPGFAGKFFRNIPWVVIAVLAISLLEALIILPAHLAHSKPPSERGLLGFVHHQQQRFSRFVEWLIEKTYVPAVRWATDRRYLAGAIGVAILVAGAGMVSGGRIHFVFMPRIESDLAVAMVELPIGTSTADTKVLQRRLESSLHEALDELDGNGAVEGIFSQSGAATMSNRGGPAGSRSSSGGHIAEVAVSLVPIDERDFGTEKLNRLWRKKLGELPGVEALKFKGNTGGSGQAPIAYDLSHPDSERLEQAAVKLAAKIATYQGVFDIDDGLEAGKAQLDFELKPAARRMGLTELDVARQLRSTFFGAEAVRQQRGRDEVRTYVRYPRELRETEHSLETFLLRTREGGEIPLDQAVSFEEGRAYTSIQRHDFQRVVTVTSDLDFSVGNGDEIAGDLEGTFLPTLLDEYPGLTWKKGGERRHQAEAMGGLVSLFVIALVAIFALLAIAFRSYVQPVLIMAAIPFGFVGALAGHLLMGFDLSMISVMGIVALSGIVVNDSLVLIVAVNGYREREGLTPLEAVRLAGARRFRPIILTSLTTFFGLMPMIFETSVQARFLIPMAISLGFGVLFATVITLILLPAFYMILDDAARVLGGAWRWLWSDHEEPAEPEVGPETVTE
ncbi:MAG: efflux RND transporter permease subunit [Deltaproteobacteria bacterium]|nr:efflux RND transporter permease subunit [Deltaproteobacteria bacterium]